MIKKVVFIFLIASIMLAGCSPVMGEYFDQETGQIYQIVAIPDNTGSDIRYELIPLDPLTEEEKKGTLLDWGYSPEDQVQILALEGSFQIDGDGVITVAALNMGGGFSPSPDFSAGPEDCKAFAVHLIKRVVTDGMTWATLGSLITAIAENRINPTVIGVSSSGDRAVIKMIHEGINIILIIGKGVNPTLFQPISAEKVSALLHGLTRFKDGKHFMSVVQSAATFMKCVKENWPTSKEAIEEARKLHNSRYGRSVDEVPNDFPTKLAIQNSQLVLEINWGTTSIMTSESIRQETMAELQVLLILGLVVVGPMAISAVEVPTTVTLMWATELVH